MKENIIPKIQFVENALKKFRPNSRALQKEEIPEIRIVELNSTKKWSYHFDIPTAEGDEVANPNCCFIRYHEFGYADHKLRLSTEIAHNYFKEAFYNQLRTNEQLGYCVWA